MLRVPNVVPSMIVHDRRAIPSTQQGCLMGYVDNIIVFGTEKDRVQELLRGVNSELRSVGLIVHEIQEGDSIVESLGWEFHREAQLIKPKSRRLWRLWYALDHALVRGQLSGHQLHRLVGHYISMGLIRRECLAVVNSCYAFCQAHPDHTNPLWPSVMRELRWMRSLIPYMMHRLVRPIMDRVLAFDASEWGKGVVQCKASTADVNILVEVQDR